MAEAFSGWGNHYGWEYMRAHVVAWTEYTDDDHYKIIVTGNTQCQNCGAGWSMQSQVGYDARYSGIPYTSTGAGGQSFSWAWCTEGHYFESVEAGSGGAYADYHREEFGPFTCDASEHNVTVWYKCWAAGSWAGGERDAFATLTVPRPRQHTPRSPKSFKAARVSDNSQKLTWDGDYTDWDGHYTWAYVHVERKDGDGGFSQVKRLDWSATNWTDNTTKPGWKYTYRLRASNYDGAYSAYTSEITVYTTPNGLASLSIEKTGAHSVKLTGRTLWGWRDGVYMQRSVNGGAWSAASVSETSTGVWVDSNAPAGTLRYRVAAYVRQGGSVNPTNLLQGVWTTTGEVTTICAPNAPAVSTAPASPVECPAQLAVSWVPDHPDGTEQTAALISISGPDGSKINTYSGASAKRTVALTVTGTYTIKVKTKGLADDYGPWSDPVTVVCAYAPAASFTSPAAPYDGTNPQRKLPVEVKWTASDATGVTRQYLCVRALSSASAMGPIIWGKQLSASARSCSLGAEVGLENGSSYYIGLTVYGGSGLSATAATSVHTDWAQPVPPDATITYSDDDLSATVSVDAGIDDTSYYVGGSALRGPMTEADGAVTLLGAVEVAGTALVLDGVLNIESYDLVRVDDLDGGRTLLGSDLPLGYRIIDPLPPLNTDYHYEVTAKTSLGTVAKKLFEARLDSKGMEAFNFGAAAQTCIALGLNADDKETFENTGESYYFALGSDSPALPTFYPDGTLDSSRSLSYVVHSREEYERIRKVARNRDMSHFWYRDFWGHRMYAHGKWSLGYAAKSYSLWDVSVSADEVVWREPVNGQ